MTGDVLIDDQDLLKIDPVGLRQNVGMVFQKPNPFPKTIFDNIAYGQSKWVKEISKSWKKL